MNHAAIECARCGMHLPLKRDLAADQDQATWICANCGWQMPGVLDPAARDTIQENVAPVVPPEDIDTESNNTQSVEIRREHYSGDTVPLLHTLLSRCLSGSSAAR